MWYILGIHNLLHTNALAKFYPLLLYVDYLFSSGKNYFTLSKHSTNIHEFMFYKLHNMYRNKGKIKTENLT